MNYGGGRTAWSSCSNADFKDLYSKVIDEKGEFCLEDPAQGVKERKSRGYANNEPDQLCHTEYEKVTSYYQKCSNSYEKECSTSYAQECSTSYVNDNLKSISY